MNILKFACETSRRVATWSAISGIGMATVAAAALELDRLDPVPADRPIPIQDFFRPAVFSSPQLNPAGTHVAALSSGGSDGYQLIVHDIEAGESRVVEGVGSMDVTSFRWLGNDRIAFHTVTDRQRQGALLAVNEKGRSRPYPLIQGGGVYIIGVPLDERESPVAWVNANGVTDTQGEVVVLDTAVDSATIVDTTGNEVPQGAYEQIVEQNRRAVKSHVTLLGFGASASYQPDAEGRLSHAIVTNDGLESLHAWNDGKWTRSPVDLETMTVHGAGIDHGQVLVSLNRFDGEVSPVHLMNAATGELGAEILRDSAYDFTGWIIRHPGNGALVGLGYHRTMPTFVWFDEGYRAVYNMLKSSFPKKIVQIVSVDDAASVFIVGVYDDRTPISYHIANLTERTVGPLKTSRPWLDENRLSRVSMIKFKTAEGHRLDAFITLPRGVSASNPAPLVVLPHSGLGLNGQWSRDTLGYHAMAQFLASRGYGVLQPNYRGTPGTNWMFPEADQWDFLKMHDDVTRATQTALKTKLFDPERVAIMGDQFGAYLALSGAVHEPDLYRCVVGMNGRYDMVEVMRELRFNLHSSGPVNRLNYKLGEPGKNREKFRQISPINFVDQMKAPMLVTQGRDNPSLHRLESRRLLGALDRADVPHDSIFTEREGWGELDLENRMEVMAKIEQFLARNL
jgi:dipeptidyl aminopeptidase/acylaminoacyl peptidase